MAKVKTKYICQNCGYETPKWMGKCPECQKWNTLVEELVETASQRSAAKRSFVSSNTSSKPVRINDIKAKNEDRFSSGIKELDRVLGGGIVRGSLVLVGGDPGIGKSTLLIQVSNEVAKSGKKVIYVSGEESESQIKLRASRLGIDSENLYVYTENDMEIIAAYIENLMPELVIADSIQTMQNPSIQSAPGTVSQIKEATSQFMRISKRMGIATMIVGHVTKEGAIAGPKILEHMVDTVMYFEGERFNTYRILRSVKNRFGSTNELGVFEMKNSGLEELENPSRILISEKPEDVSGSVIISTVEGTRPMLLELQALVATSNYGYPKRTATGVDPNRVSLIIAVLEKKVAVQIQNSDVYINIVGGIKINEPSMDLGIALAICSSFRNKPIKNDVAVCGEVGLTGEIRAINFVEKRIDECRKLGFKKILIPKSNLYGLKKYDDIEVVGVYNLRQAINEVI